MVNLNRIVVIHGLHDDFRVINPDFATYYRVDDLQIHPDSRSFAGIEVNDLALLRVEQVLSPARAQFWEKIHFATKVEVQAIEPICVSKLNSVLRNEDECFVAGYGSISETGNHWNYGLNHVAMERVSRAECLKVNTMIPAMQEQEGSDSYFCAGIVNKTDSCRGDSGGPLMCFDETSQRWQIKGEILNCQYELKT